MGCQPLEVEVQVEGLELEDLGADLEDLETMEDSLEILFSQPQGLGGDLVLVETQSSQFKELQEEQGWVQDLELESQEDQQLMLDNLEILVSVPQEVAEDLG